MRVLVDSTFPASTDGPQPRGHHIHRYDGGSVSDADLIELAKRKGFEAIVFLGSDALADPRLGEAGALQGILVAASASDDSAEAEVAIKANLGALAAHVGFEAPVIIRKTGVVRSVRTD